MTYYDTFGSTRHAAGELALLVGGRLGLDFEARESDFRGTYWRVVLPDGHIEVQPQAIPGDDGRDDLYDAGLPALLTLVLVMTEASDAGLREALGGIAGLSHLSHESE
ncbi:hypothetical protein LG634_26410 [Streptomyces bambusae]|uniref:hypothetical protein n=1 Tax=Streptomyces bambusae TaxID=1550616 RepID=UPI001CFD9A6E|nr:hypothetical protein [Streptomyces bambusae]MCB5168344.1 hypothetical protein [Streptomyces bambusae]